jgi:hypothetical protein
MLEPHMNAELLIFGVVERSERRRSDVGLDVGREKRVQGVDRADPEPRLPPADRDAALDPDIETVVGRKALRVARADELQRFVDD